MSFQASSPPEDLFSCNQHRSIPPLVSWHNNPGLYWLLPEKQREEGKAIDPLSGGQETLCWEGLISQGGRGSALAWTREGKWGSAFECKDKEKRAWRKSGSSGRLAYGSCQISEGGAMLSRDETAELFTACPPSSPRWDRPWSLFNKQC